MAGRKPRHSRVRSIAKSNEDHTMKTIPQALRQRARRILAAMFAEIASLTSGRNAQRADAPHMRRRRVEGRSWPRVR
jgi:hypothetical protein